MSDTALTSEQREFHLKEFKELKKEMSFVVGLAWKSFYYAIIFCGAFFGWIVTNRHGPKDGGAIELIDPVTWKIIVWVPSVVSLGAMLLAAGLYVRVAEIGGYLDKLAEYLAHPNLRWDRQGTKRVMQGQRLFFDRGITKPALVLASCWILFVAANIVASWRLLLAP